MALNNVEFETIMNDTTKCIQGDIAWKQDEDHSPAWEFQADIESESGWPLFIRGRYNPKIPVLSYALILKTEGRIYALDLGKDHHNPQCDQVGERHKHRWSEQYRDKEAYVPKDVSALASDPLTAWKEFCDEAKIQHKGTMKPLPTSQGEVS